MEYGLYLTIKENNRMERHMISPKGEELMWESTIQDEIIAFLLIDLYMQQLIHQH